MKTVAKVLLIIGLSLGSLGGISRVVTFALGDTLLSVMKGNASQFQDNYLPFQEGLRQMTAKTFSNVASIAGNLLLVIAGGTTGLLAVATSTQRRWRIVFSIAAIASGLGLLAMRSWICASAYAIAGFVLLATSDPEGDASDKPA